jgi:hypothetical protein
MRRTRTFSTRHYPIHSITISAARCKGNSNIPFNILLPRRAPHPSLRRRSAPIFLFAAALLLAGAPHDMIYYFGYRETPKNFLAFVKKNLGNRLNFCPFLLYLV